MYLHLGQSVVVPFRDVVGIFDLDNTTSSIHTRKFLERAEKEGRVVDKSTLSGKTPKVPCAGPGIERRWSISPNSPRPPCSSGWRTTPLNECPCGAHPSALFLQKGNGWMRSAIKPRRF